MWKDSISSYEMIMSMDPLKAGQAVAFNGIKALGSAINDYNKSILDREEALRKKEREDFMYEQLKKDAARKDETYQISKNTEDLVKSLLAAANTPTVDSKTLQEMNTIKDKLSSNTYGLSNNEAKEFKDITAKLDNYYANAANNGTLNSDNTPPEISALEQRYAELQRKAQLGMNKEVAKSALPDLASRKYFSTAGLEESLNKIIADAVANGKNFDTSTVMQLRNNILKSAEDAVDKNKKAKINELLLDYSTGVSKDAILKKAANLGITDTELTRGMLDIDKFKEDVNYHNANLAASYRTALLKAANESKPKMTIEERFAKAYMSKIAQDDVTQLIEKIKIGSTQNATPAQQEEAKKAKEEYEKLIKFAEVNKIFDANGRPDPVAANLYINKDPYYMKGIEKYKNLGKETDIDDDSVDLSKYVDAKTIGNAEDVAAFIEFAHNQGIPYKKIKETFQKVGTYDPWFFGDNYVNLKMAKELLGLNKKK